MSEALPTAEAEARARVPMLTRILRTIGAGVLIASASSFLVHQWEAGNDIQRYLALLAHTAALCAAGFFCGLRIHDSKSARTFLAVAAALVPAHFCILGGLLYSQLGLDGGSARVAQYATWVAPSPLAALLTVAGALLVLTPVTAISFLALARSRARELTAVYLGLNLTMLLPTRDPEPIALLVGLGVAVLGFLELRRFRGDASLRTLEGGFVRAMLVSPVVLLLARSVLHYELSWLFHGVLFAAGSLLLFATARELGRPRSAAPTAIGSAALGRAVFSRPALAHSLQGLAAVFAGATWLCWTGALQEGMGLPDAALIPMTVLPFAATLLAMSLFAIGSGALYRRAAVAIAMGGMALDLALFPSVGASLVCLGLAISTLAYGYLLERRLLLLTGVAGLVFALVHHVSWAIELYAWSHWGSLALLGGAVIMSASLLERHHDRVIGQLTGLRERFASWDA